MSVLPAVVATLLVALGGLWIVVGTLGLTGRLPRNRWLGVRSADTLASDDAFRLANRVAAPGTVGAGVILLISAALTLAVAGAWSVLFGLAGLVVALMVVGVVSGYGLRAAAAVAPTDAGCGCCSDDADSTPAQDAASTDVCGTAGPNADSCGACSLRGSCANTTQA